MLPSFFLLVAVLPLFLLPNFSIENISYFLTLFSLVSCALLKIELDIVSISSEIIDILFATNIL